MLFRQPLKRIVNTEFLAGLTSVKKPADEQGSGPAIAPKLDYCALNIGVKGAFQIGQNNSEMIPADHCGNRGIFFQ